MTPTSARTSLPGRLVVPVRAAARRSGGAGLRVLERGLAAWRRSLQLRVGATTLIVTGAVVLLIGVFLVSKVTDGVLHAKRDAAISQADLGSVTARGVTALIDGGIESQVLTARNALVSQLTSNGTSAGVFSVELKSSLSSANEQTGETPIPAPLQRLVRSGQVAYQYADVHPTNTSPRLVHGLIVGEPVPSRNGNFQLYYLFPLTAEEQTVALVQRTVLLAGVALVVLVLVIALLVTRQVVRPVRVAAETAGQLAAGDLSQRIETSGSDDIARLGESFNDMADSLQRQIRRLEDLSRLQRRFTSDVSHELRTPLTTIRMASEFLYASRSDFPAEVARSAELLTDELDRFESLLADLLEISRYDAGAAQLEAESVDIRAVVSTTVDGVRVLAHRQGSEIVVVQPDKPVPVDMDPRRVERILRNLIGNAVDHGEGKPVIVTVGHDENAVAVTVRDHGVGLRPGEAALVFNRFWRGDVSRSRLTGGTGLGLAIALEDARLHDGWLQAWGERGHGAQFRLTLPRHAGHTLFHSPLPLAPDDEDDES